MPLVIFQLNNKIETNTMTNMPNKMLMEHTIPVEDTGTGFWKTMVNKNHGNGRLKQDSDENANINYYDYLPNSDIKNIRAYWGGDSHVAKSLPGNDNTGEKIGYGSPSSQEG